MIEFLSQSDMTYTKYEVSGQCLFRKVGWWVKDLLDIINGSELHSSNFVSIFLEKLTFSQLYDFIKSHKQFVYDKNIFYTSCLCDNCKNIVFLGLKVWAIINDSQLQLVFPKHCWKIQLFIWWQRLHVWWLYRMFIWKTIPVTWFQPWFRIWFRF